MASFDILMAIEMNILIQNGTILTMCNRKVIRQGTIAIEDKTSHIVYAVKASDADTVMINGRIVMENRKFTTLSVENVMVMVEKTKNNLLSKLNVIVK